jgi:hypothetical protein
VQINHLLALLAAQEVWFNGLSVPPDKLAGLQTLDPPGMLMDSYYGGIGSGRGKWAQRVLEHVAPVYRPLIRDARRKLKAHAQAIKEQLTHPASCDADLATYVALAIASAIVRIRTVALLLTGVLALLHAEERGLTRVKYLAMFLMDLRPDTPQSLFNILRRAGLLDTNPTRDPLLLQMDRDSPSGRAILSQEAVEQALRALSGRLDAATAEAMAVILGHLEIGEREAPDVRLLKVIQTALALGLAAQGIIEGVGALGRALVRAGRITARSAARLTEAATTLSEEFDVLHGTGMPGARASYITRGLAREGRAMLGGLASETEVPEDAVGAVAAGKRPGGGEPPAGRPQSPYPEKTPDGNPLSDHLRGHRDAATRLKEVPPETIDDVLRKPPLRVDSDGASVYFDAERNVTIVKNEAGEVIMARRGPPGKPR